MTKRLSFRLGIAGLLAAGSTAWATGLQTQDRALCSLPDHSTYSPGALVKHDDQVYRCTFAWAGDLTPSGVAWVKVVPQGTGFVLKEGPR